MSLSVVSVARALDEALAENEREQRTDIWVSFWDRLTNGGPIPERGVHSLDAVLEHFGYTREDLEADDDA